MSIATESSVRERYARGATSLEPELCCPVDYDPRYLAAILVLALVALLAGLAQNQQPAT